MIMFRDAVLTATILALIFIADNRLKPVKAVQVDYCQVGSQFWPCAGLMYTLNI